MKINCLNLISKPKKYSRFSSFGSDSASSKRFFLSDRDKEVIFKNGLAVLKDNGELFSGTITNQDKSGNKWSLTYSQGQIVSVNKNGALYKKYLRYTDKKDKTGNLIKTGTMIENAAVENSNVLGYESFNDGSRIPRAEFWEYKNPEVTRIYYPSDKTTTITHNPHPKYKKEPTIEVKTHYANSDSLNTEFTYYNPYGKEKIRFRSTDDAKKYFKHEYGIDVNVDTIAQAHIIKLAVDDFVEIYKNKRCLEGLRFISGIPYRKGSTAEYATTAKIAYKNKEDDYKLKTLSPEDKTKFIQNHKPDILKIFDYKICLNRNVNWNGIDYYAFKNGLSRCHSSYTIKGSIQHEIGHYLHSKNNPYLYLFCNEKPPEDLATIVSGYAKVEIDEFVAEYIAGKLSGKKYPKEVDKLYEQYGGPNIFTQI